MHECSHRLIMLTMWLTRHILYEQLQRLKFKKIFIYLQYSVSHLSTRVAYCNNAIDVLLDLILDNKRHLLQVSTEAAHVGTIYYN